MSIRKYLPIFFLTPPPKKYIYLVPHPGSKIKRIYRCLSLLLVINIFDVLGISLLLEIIIFSLLVWKLEHSILIPRILLIHTKSKLLVLSILSTKVGKHLCLLRVRRVHQLCLLSTKMCSSMYYMYKNYK